MNETQKLLLVLLISIEIAFTQSVYLNLLLILISIIILIISKSSIKSFVRLILVCILPTIGSFTSFYFFGTGEAVQRIHFASVMTTRVVAYVFMGAAFMANMILYKLLRSLEQNVKMSATFVYGILGALNFIPKIIKAIRTIRAVGLMRGEVLYFWSPKLYFKAITQALVWSNNLAMAMTSHGFEEGERRSYHEQFPTKLSGWIIILVIMLFIQYCLFVAKLW
ncbi:ABC transporter permease [Leuconostoc litchii]|uniref:Cobalt ABC transporter permease n=1 Tax=Leuconostoc litchii TaxID=1981069 RepID=A0A6P2CLK8_9LACO|nr:energy-coupling factor transporter transmembrane component T [Leuconostoc litchii]TYC46176.1 cobalt ABC transporter permease [Leuconostoc litchii]GMA70370.1 ABC transporter permease [Leuconostoc litchii]